MLCETYPGEAYAHVGAAFENQESERNQRDRAARAGAVMSWAARNRVILELAASAAIIDGFGPSKDGEDPFDAMMGLLGMIEVVSGRRSEGPVTDPTVLRWEGWIIGQADR